MNNTLGGQARGAVWKILESIFPFFCLGCAQEGTVICEDCFLQINPRLEIVQQKPKVLDEVYVLGEFDHQNVFTKLIEYYKYSYVYEAGEALQRLIHKSTQNMREFKEVDCVIPIPLHRKRFAYRGYNQSDILASALGDVFECKTIGALKRVKATQQQARLSRQGRTENMKDSFVCCDKTIQKKSVLLVDDVFTTGATMAEAAKVLKKNGATRVIGFAVVHGS